MTIDTAKLKASTKSLVGIVFAFGTFMEIPAVNAYVTPILAGHPRLTPFIGALVGLYALLHNPTVTEALGIKTTVETKKTVEKVEIPEGTRNDYRDEPIQGFSQSGTILTRRFRC